MKLPFKIEIMLLFCYMAPFLKVKKINPMVTKNYPFSNQWVGKNVSFQNMYRLLLYLHAFWLYTAKTNSIYSQSSIMLLFCYAPVQPKSYVRQEPEKNRKYSTTKQYEVQASILAVQSILYCIQQSSIGTWRTRNV